MIAPKLIPLFTGATLDPTTVPVSRLIAGAALSVAVAGTARALRSLSWSGAVAAVGVGTLAVAAGWGWGILLIGYFVLSTALSRVGAKRKQQRTGAIVEKGGARDAVQVFANGGVFAALALATLLAPSPLWRWGALGALAAAAADTWATEIGTLIGGTPRSIVTRTIVRIGESGGVTLAGSLGGAAGAAVIVLIGWLAGWRDGAPFTAASALVAGVAGMFADSLLGATVQDRRWCNTCNAATERMTHDCDTATRHVGGVPWIRNDLVNALARLVGAAIALLGAQWAA